MKATKRLGTALAAVAVTTGLLLGTSAAQADPPVANAGGPYDGEQGIPVEFDGTGSADPDGDIVRYDWNFGDGAVGTGLTPSHTYSSPNRYYVTLRVTDALGDVDGADTTAQIVPPGANNLPPVAIANGPYSGTVGSPVAFDSSGSDDQDGDIVEWNWSFGDGTVPSFEENPTHIYDEAGEYFVALTVRDNWGVQSEPSFTIAFISATGPDNDAPIAEAGGPYTAEEGNPVDFDGSKSSDPDGTIVSYDWDFGDGNTGTGMSPTHTYASYGNYDAVLKVTDNSGTIAGDYAYVEITRTGPVNEPPIADAGDPYDGEQGIPVEFDGSLSDDPDGTIAGYSWLFGDGGTGYGETTSYTYPKAGIYKVRLDITDDGGDTDSDTTYAYISQGELPPVADAGGPYYGWANVELNLYGGDSTSSNPRGRIVHYDWDYGDGKVDMDAGPSPTHIYTTDGLYEVTLTVTDEVGGTDEDTTSYQIGVADELPPRAEAKGPYIGTVNAPIEFDGTASFDNDGDIVSWNWDFGDGKVDNSGPTPSHVYTTSGLFLVTLTVEDDDGLIDSTKTTAISVFDRATFPWTIFIPAITGQN